MRTTPHRRTVAAVSAAALLALPAASPAQQHPAKDYSQNAAGGDYTPAVRSAPRVDGIGITPIHTQVGPAVTERATVTSGEDGFSWASAATGAGIALLVSVGIGLGGRTVVRRRGSLAGA